MKHSRKFDLIWTDRHVKHGAFQRKNYCTVLYERMRGPEGQCAYERGSKFPGKGLWILKHRKTAPTISTRLPTPTIIATTLPRGSNSERVFLRRARVIHRVPLVLPWFGPDRAFPLAYSHTPRTERRAYCLDSGVSFHWLSKPSCNSQGCRAPTVDLERCWT